MKTDVDSALKEIADFFLKNKREMTQSELEPILLKHCGSEAEVRKFVKFLETEPGQLRFKTHLTERKQPSFSGRQISEELGVKYDGVQKGIKDIPSKMQFTDPQTGSTTYGNTLEEVRTNLENMRAKFKPGQPSTLIEPECEIISPQDYDLLKWMGIQAPDYSFAFEPETRERKLAETLKRLREGVENLQTGEQFREFLLTMSKFHSYSISNQILIMLQRRNATHVAGFVKWKELGRHVKYGETGIAILAPCETKTVKVESYQCQSCGRAVRPVEKWANGLKPKCPYCGGEVQVGEEEMRPLYFKVVNVFDISQTEGKPLPEFEIPALTGAANEELFNKVMALAKAQGLDVSFESRPRQDPQVKGTYIGNNIWVRPEESRAQQLKTILHEDAHYLTESVFRIPRDIAEVLAESCAFVVGAHFGFDTGTRSFPYIALWSKDKKVLEQNLTAICKTAERMIQGLEA